MKLVAMNIMIIDRDLYCVIYVTWKFALVGLFPENLILYACIWGKFTLCELNANCHELIASMLLQLPLVLVV